MEVVPSLQRRKACDLCFTKKIKCDMLEPTCSNCKQYKAVCKTTAIRRRTGPPRERGAPPVATPAQHQQQLPDHQAGPEADRIEVLESRLRGIESQLQQVISLVSTTMSHVARSQGLQQGISPPSDSSDSTRCCPLTATHDSPCEEAVVPQESMLVSYKLTLPPLDEILGIVDSYFMHFNQLVPLFQQSIFMRMLHEWYNYSAQRTLVKWAAINVVLGIGYRQVVNPTMGIRLDHIEEKKVRACFEKARSVLPELAAHDQDLLGMQTILGLVLLAHSSKEMQDSVMIIGIAARLAHRLKLHVRDAHAGLPQQVATQRDRLFWIMYMLDKDISMRQAAPSVQLDSDIDLDLPPVRSEDGFGEVCSMSGTRFPLFRMRVQLAHISGLVYDLLSSARSARITEDERQRRVARLGALLAEWHSRIPDEMQMDNVLENLAISPMIHVVFLHTTYTMCLIISSGSTTRIADWVTRIACYGSVILQHSNQPDNDPRGEKAMSHHMSLSFGWDRCVQESRSCLRMLMRMPQAECLIWTNTCVYIFTLVILLVEMIKFPDHPLAAADKELTSETVVLCGKLAAAINKEGIKRLNAVIRELQRTAFDAAAAAASGGKTPAATTSNPVSGEGVAEAAAQPPAEAGAVDEFSVDLEAIEGGYPWLGETIFGTLQGPQTEDTIQDFLMSTLSQDDRLLNHWGPFGAAQQTCTHTGPFDQWVASSGSDVFQSPMDSFHGNGNGNTAGFGSNH